MELPGSPINPDTPPNTIPTGFSYSYSLIIHFDDDMVSLGDYFFSANTKEAFPRD